ncbi:MAG: TetR/AcrR family transcriptional regulator [Betaproteobacteria bacterium]|nr:TetR/AcrR family transcriptional regulator [Betaproteobacteria bacterium]
MATATRTRRPAEPTTMRDGQRMHRCQRFVEVAEQLFLERGFAGTSVNEVVRLAGGSLATLYTEFGTKEQLFEAVMSRRVANLFSNALGGASRTRPIEAELLQLAKRFQDHMLAEQALAIYRLAVHEGPKFPSVRKAILVNGLTAFLDRLASYFNELGQTGRLQIDSPHRAAEDFLTLVQGQLRTIAACGDVDQISAKQRNDHVKHAVRSFLRIYPPGE